MNVVGGLVILGMAMTYYLLATISGKPVWSKRLLNHSFWWTAIGVCCFYSTLVVFGIIEGNQLLENPEGVPAIHHTYGLVISVAATIMGTGFWVFFINVFLTVKKIYSTSSDDT
jgi:heme/copper-type cytochrome/quinol oxidase subunit 1